MGTASRSAKLKGDNPDASNSDLQKASRAIGLVGLELRKDKSCDLTMGGNTMKGDWSFDKERGEVQLDLKTVDSGEANKGQNPADFKPVTWVAYRTEGRLDLWMADRQAVETIKSIAGAKPLIIKLRKN